MIILLSVLKLYWEVVELIEEEVHIHKPIPKMFCMKVWTKIPLQVSLNFLGITSKDSVLFSLQLLVADNFEASVL